MFKKLNLNKEEKQQEAINKNTFYKVNGVYTNGKNNFKPNKTLLESTFGIKAQNYINRKILKIEELNRLSHMQDRSPNNLS